MQPSLKIINRLNKGYIDESALALIQIDVESVFALNPDVAPDEEIPSPEGPSSNFAKTSKLPKVCF